MKKTWIAGITVAGVVLFLIVPASFGITIVFDDLTDKLVTTVTPPTAGTIFKLTNEDSNVTLTNAFAADQAFTVRAFALVEPANSDRPAGSLSDIIIFITAPDAQHKRDYLVAFGSDTGESTPMTTAKPYGSLEESGGFQTIPLPTDAPVPADLIVKVRSDAPRVRIVR